MKTKHLFAVVLLFVFLVPPVSGKPLEDVIRHSFPQEVSERITDLPETSGNWHLSIFMPPNWEEQAELKEIVSWFATEPRLVRLGEQTLGHVYTTDDPLYKPVFSGAVPKVPAIILQDERGVPRYKVGDTIPVPESGEDVADGIVRCIAALDGGEVGGWLFDRRPRPNPRPRPRPFCNPDGDCKPKPDDTDDDDADDDIVPNIPDLDGSGETDIPPAPDIVPLPNGHTHDAIVARLDELFLMLKNLPVPKDGIDGKDGLPGECACPSTDELVAAITVKIQATILQQMGEQFGALDVRITKLEEAQGTLESIQASLDDLVVRVEILEKQPPSPEPTPTMSHMVLVRDASAEYWPRLDGELEAARGYYSAIREADPPAFSVELPVLVGYSDGSPIWRISGLRDVGNALRLITRNQFDPSSF